MRLLELKVKNFRGIGQGYTEEGIQIKFGRNNIILIIGKNNTGKSSILEAYDYFYRGQPAFEDDFYKKSGFNIEIEATSSKEDIDQSFMEELQLSLDELDEEIRVKRIWSSSGENPSLSVWDGQWKVIEDNSKIKKWNNKLKEDLPEPIWIRGHLSSEQALIEIQNLVKHAILESLRSDNTYQKAVDAVRDLQKLVRDSDYSKAFQKKINSGIGNIFPEVSFKIDSQSDKLDIIKLIEKGTRVQTQSGKNSPDINLDWQGHGVRRQFILSLYKECHTALRAAKSKKKSAKELSLTEADQHKSKILLVEEPELFLHPYAVRLVQKVLYEIAENESQFQVLCATHSPAMINLEYQHSSLVRLSKDSSNCVTAYQVESDRFNNEREQLRVLKEFNPYYCEAFFADKVLLVEGQTEAFAAKVLLDAICESYQLEEELFIVDCGGKTTIPLFQKILENFRIPYYVIHDLDQPVAKNGNVHPSWKPNFDIQENLESAQANGLQARAFIFNPCFEECHGYKTNGKDKPLDAYKRVIKWAQDLNKAKESKDIVKFMLAICGQNSLETSFNREWIENNRNYVDLEEDIDMQMCINMNYH